VSRLANDGDDGGGHFILRAFSRGARMLRTALGPAIASFLEGLGPGSRTPSGPAVPTDCITTPDRRLRPTDTPDHQIALATREPSTEVSLLTARPGKSRTSASDVSASKADRRKSTPSRLEWHSAARFLRIHELEARTRAGLGPAECRVPKTPRMKSGLATRRNPRSELGKSCVRTTTVFPAFCSYAEPA
jgi:hypothetical protein